MENLKLEPSKREHVPLFVEMENAPGATEFLNPDSAEKHLSEMSKEDIIYLNILVDSQIKGFFILVVEENSDVEFRRVVVGDREKGIGQPAIAEMEKYASTQLNAKRIWLDVFEHNKRGMHIYRKLGYRDFKSLEHKKGRLIFMEKSL